MSPRSRKIVVGSAVVAVTFGLVALVLLPDKRRTPAVDSEAIGHARTACEVTEKARVAAQVDSPERYAAASFLMDRAILESGRAAEMDAAFLELDRAVNGMHTAAHAGRREPWLVALEAAVKACEQASGS